METYYYLYKITNKINGNVYIGVHKTNNLKNTYMGSGKYIKRAIKKHGLENFEKEILQTFSKQEDMYQAESLLVNEDFVKRKDTYNIKLGGQGGFDHLNKLSKDELSKRSKALNKLPNKRFAGKVHSIETKRRMSDAQKGHAGTYGFLGKKHSEESKKQMSEKISIKQQGSKNSQYGTCWIFNETKSIKIKKEDLQNYLEAGWQKGRRMIV